MNNINIEQINQAYDRLPDELKAFFDSEETAKTISAIGKKYNLHIDQLGQLAQTIHLVILGLLSRESFVLKLKNDVGISEDTANLITYDINQEIFLPMRNKMKESDYRGDTTASKELFEQKMSGVANVPKQTIEVISKTEDNEGGKAVKMVRDPYREATN